MATSVSHLYQDDWMHLLLLLAAPFERKASELQIHQSRF